MDEVDITSKKTDLSNDIQVEKDTIDTVENTTQETTKPNLDTDNQNGDSNSLDITDSENTAENAENDAKIIEKESETKDSAALPVSEPTASSEQSAGESHEATEPTKVIIKCVLCDVTLSKADRPMLLECLHSACSACIDAKLQEQPDQEQDVLDSNAVLCPWCSITSDRKNLIVDRFVLELCPGDGSHTGAEEETAEAPICVSCDEHVPASSFCEDCSELLCDACVQAHRRVRITKDHRIVEKGQAGQRQRSGSTSGQEAGVTDLRCTTHPAESLSLFCEKCDQLTCRDCQLTEHREHKFKFVNEIASDARRGLASLLNEVTYKRGLLESAVKVIDKRHSAINDKKQQVVKEITNLVITLTNAINSRGKQLVQRLGEVCDNKQRTLAEKRTTLQQLTRLTDHCINAVNSQLDNGSDLTLLWSKKTIMRHLQRIKCRRADIPNPDIPVRIHFAQQRVDTLCNALATVGGIVVDGRPYPHSELPETRLSRSPGLVTATSQQAPSVAQQQQQHHPQQQHQQPPQQQTNSHISLAHQAGGSTHHPVHHRAPQPPMPHQQSISIRLSGNTQVSSSTHPGVQQLRNLLSPNNIGSIPNVRIGPGGQLPMLRPLNLPPPQLPQQQQQQGIQLQGQLHVQGVRVPIHRPPPPLTPANAMAPSLVPSRGPVWHIPPGSQSSAPIQPSLPSNDNFRITLTNQWLPASEQVSSSGIQRSSPSPAANSNASSKSASDVQLHFDNFAQDHRQLERVQLSSCWLLSWKELDSFQLTMILWIENVLYYKSELCKHRDFRQLDLFKLKSMDELFSTIAHISAPSKPKPTSTGSATETSASSTVDSSTGSPSQRSGTTGAAQESISPVKDDPNDDWCAVCMDGGDLVCCDRCPKVFHTFCHIPQLGSIDETPDSWQCLLCTPISEILQTPNTLFYEGQKLNAAQYRTAQRLLLELYCQYDHSQPFREPVNTEMFPNYLRVVQHPMSLDIIKRRLEKDRPDSYSDLQHFVNDVRQIFKNAYIFNTKGSAVYNDAQALEDIFEGMLSKWLPQFASSTRLYNIHETVVPAASPPADPLDEGAVKRKKPRIE